MAASSGARGIRPEDINELVRDLVQRHAGAPPADGTREEPRHDDRPLPGSEGAGSVHAAASGAEQPFSTNHPPSQFGHHSMSNYAGQPAHQQQHAGPEMGLHYADGRNRMHDGSAIMDGRNRMHDGPAMMYGMHGGGHRDYNLIREPLFTPHGGMHPGMAHVPRPVHTGHLGNYGPSQYLDHAMMEEYSHKMQMLQHDFDVMLRPKLDSLHRQVVTVEERIREVSLMKDQLLEEAVLDHRALMEQIHLSSDRRLGALTLDLEQLMRDVALIHDLIQQLSPAQQGPQTPTAVWALLSRYDELSNACHQLASKRFKTTVEESAGDLREEVGRMRWPAPHLAPHPKGARHIRDRSASPSKRPDGSNATKELEGAGGPQVEEMRALLQVKDQMVWMMLEERNKLHDEKRALQEETESLQQEAQIKDAKIEALEKGALANKAALEEAEKWRQLCEGYEARLAQQQTPAPMVREASDPSAASSAERAAASAGKDVKLAESRRAAPKPSQASSTSGSPQTSTAAGAAQTAPSKPPDQASGSAKE